MAKKKTLKKLSTAALRKKYPSSGISSDIVVSSEEMLWLPSRFLALNDLLGGGIPFGKILELYGEESSGKSLLAFDFAYGCQALGGQVLWADSEYAFTRDWALQNKLDLDKVELFREKAIESISDWSIDMGRYYRSILPMNAPILLVIDSIAALDTLGNMDTSQVDRKAEMGNRAKAMDGMLRTRNGLWESLGISVILINQLRSNLKATQFQDPDTTPGGKATRYYASQRVGVYGGKQIKEKIGGYDERVGRVTSIRIKKNKVAPPKPTIKSAPVYFHEKCSNPVGFSKYFNLPEILEKRGVLERKKNSSVYYYQGEKLATGEARLMKKINTDSKLRKELIFAAGINTISRTRKKIKNITHDMFPLDNTKDLEDE